MLYDVEALVSLSGKHKNHFTNMICSVYKHNATYGFTYVIKIIIFNVSNGNCGKGLEQKIIIWKEWCQFQLLTIFYFIICPRCINKWKMQERIKNSQCIFFFHLWIFTSKGWKSFSNIAKALILNSQKRRKIESRNFIHHSRCMIFFTSKKKHTKSIEIKINILREGKWRHMTMMRIKGRDHPASIKIQMTFCTAVAASSSLSLFIAWENCQKVYKVILLMMQNDALPILRLFFLSSLCTT